MAPELQVKGIVARFRMLFVRYSIFFLFLCLVIILSIASPYFLQLRNIINVVRQITIIAIMAIGMTIIIISGGIDLSVGSVLAVGGVVAAILIKKTAMPIWTAALLGIASGGVLGLVNGMIIAFFKVPPFVSTLSMMTMARGVAYLLTGGRALIGLDKRFLLLGQGSVGFMPIMVIVLIIVAVLSALVLNLTKFGRHIYAAGGNEEAALLSGVNLISLKCRVYVIIGLLSGLAGVVLASRIDSAQPHAGLGYELDVIAATVVGGTRLTGGVGTIMGTIVGALIIGVIANGLNLLNVSPYYQMIARGAIIVGAIIVDMQTARKD